MDVAITVRAEDLGHYQNVDLTPAWAEFSAYMMAEVATMFETNGASRDHPWVPLAPMTVHARALRGRNAETILRDTQALHGSFRTLEESPGMLRWGTDDHKAIYHDSDAERSHLPQRKLIRVLERDTTFLGESVARLFDRMRPGGST